MAFQVITSVEDAIKLCDAGLLWRRQRESANSYWSEWWTRGREHRHVHEGLFAILLED